jgi:hypothetical protein
MGAPLVIGGLSGLVAGVGDYQGTGYKAQQAKKAGQIARIQADQVDAQIGRDLSTVVSNIRAIRASVGASNDSPSARALLADQDTTAMRERRIKVGGLQMQANQYDADARFYASSAKWALLGDTLGGLASAA